MKMNIPKYSIFLVSGLIAVLAIFSAMSIRANGSLEDKIANIAGTILGNNLTKQLSGDFQLGYVGDSPTYITDARPGELVTYRNIFTPGELEVTGEANFSGATNLYATTTVNNIAYGTMLKDTFTLTAGVTTTPGGIASILNTGQSKICSGVELYVTGLNDTYYFDVSTSTSATAQSSASGSLIATSTVATGTTRLIDNLFAPGTYYGKAAATGISTSTAFLWNNGTYIHATMHPVSVTASSTDYTQQASGALYVNCHAR